MADGPIEPGSVSNSSARRGTVVRVTAWLNVIDVPNTNEPVGVLERRPLVSRRGPPGHGQAADEDRQGQWREPAQPGSSAHGAHASPANRTIPRPLSDAPSSPFRASAEPVP